MLQESGERLGIKVHSAIMVEHVHRYAFAAELVAGKTVLDIASGEGYGTNLLAKHAAFVYGVDKSAEAVAHARTAYTAANIRFAEGDVTRIPLDDRSVDVVVSFETIEHLDMHDAMLQECKRVLKQDGIIIISTPDKRYYSDLPCYHNPYHVKELYETEFIDLVGRYFRHRMVYRQGIVKAGIIYRQDQPGGQLCIQHGNFDAVETGRHIQKPEYMIIVAADIPLHPLPDAVFESDAVDAKLVRELEKYKAKYEAIIKSRSFKLVSLFSSPLLWFNQKANKIKE